MPFDQFVYEKEHEELVYRKGKWPMSILFELRHIVPIFSHLKKGGKPKKELKEE